MLHLFGSEHIGVVLGDVFFVDPRPSPGQEGAESGVRLELRHLTRPPLRGSIYSAQPMSVGEPLFRVDLFESFPAGRGTRDRVHYHPKFSSWDPGPRHFDPALSAAPSTWLRERFGKLGELFPEVQIVEEDRRTLEAQAEAIVRTVDHLWTTVRSGALDPPAGWASKSSFRRGWL